MSDKSQSTAGQLPPLLKKFADRFNAEVKGDLNTWGTAKVVEHEPNYSELLIHYCLRADRKDVPRREQLSQSKKATSPASGE